MELDDETLFSAGAPLSKHAGRVVLEITERAPIERIRDVGSRVAQLRALGYRIVSLCRELGIQMIAEGIETEAERDTLVNLGGDLCQGYLFGRPQLPWANTVMGGAGRDPDSNHG
jgi:EAL domain-containing protein (putative c-di-GMP-specific phosphodiesterase class I)